MGSRAFRRRRRIGGLTAVLVLVVGAAPASAAVLHLPADGSQVNNDPAAGIDPNQNLSDESPNADVVGGALTPGGVTVPWAIFRQQTLPNKDQIFVRSFKNQWTTRGNGTVGGQSSSGPTFSGSLNFDQQEDGEAPEIDFAGAGRAVPWATWYEDTAAFTDHENIFASRFDASSGDWIFAGQSRGTGSGTVPVPSLNIKTDQSAENPSVAGGSAVDPTKPGPWVTWQETDDLAGKDQIFTSRPIGPGAANCDDVTPLGVKENTGHVPAVGGFCFQQTGILRAGANGAEPSLNVDPTRDGIEPDIAFTGAQDSVPWVVWYEVGPSGIPGLHGNDMVFAAKGVADTTPGLGGFHWVAVGNSASGILDNRGTNQHGLCAESALVEGACSLNSDPDAGAEDPRVAAGTMNPVNATSPWVVWAESVAGVDRIFVSRLVGGTNFVIANGGQPISSPAGDAVRPDITFSGNTPYVTYLQTVGPGQQRVFTGHFVNPADPTFVLDTPDGIDVSLPDIRSPISSGCLANPFNGDGTSCQGGAVGTPFFLFTDPARLFADAYDASGLTTGGASDVSQSTATVSGSVNPEGAAVKAHFDFGTTTSYGSTTSDQTIGVANTSQGFSAGLGGLPAGTTIHYRAVVTSDFGTLVGNDQTFTTAAAGGGNAAGPAPVILGVPPAPDLTPPTVTLRLKRISLKRLLKTGKLQLVLTASEASVDVITATVVPPRARASAAAKKKRRPVTIGRARATFTGPGSKTVSLRLTRRGKAALRHRRSARITVKNKATDTAGNSRTTKTAVTVRGG